MFGYAGALKADVNLRLSAYAVAPLALAAGWRKARQVARAVGATVVHGHWVIPGGAIAAAACPSLPLVVSLHGSDAYLAERSAVAGRVARRVFRRAGWTTACSDDLRTRAIALGAAADRSETVPYGVDAGPFPAERRGARAPPRSARRRRRRPAALHGRALRPQEGVRVPHRRGRAPVARRGRRSAWSSAARAISTPSCANGLDARAWPAR